MKKIGRIIGLVFLFVVVWVLWSVLSHGFSVPNAADYPHQLRVLTYNTHGLGLTGNKNAQELLAYVSSQDADIVCMQEVSVYKNSDHLSLPELRRAMRKYPYTYYDFKVYNSHRQFGNGAVQLLDGQLLDEFHVASVVWDENKISWYLDDVKTFEVHRDQEIGWDLENPQYLKANLAIGGLGGGEVDPQIQRADFVLDYVRVYQKKYPIE